MTKPTEVYHTLLRMAPTVPEADSEDAAEIAYSCGMNRAFMPVSDSEQSESERPHCIGNDLIDFLPYEDSVAADA